MTAEEKVIRRALRHLDRRQEPDGSTLERIEAKVLEAFDLEATRSGEATAAPNGARGNDDAAEVIALDDWMLDHNRAERRTLWPRVLVAAAAAVAVVAVAVSLTVVDREPSVDTTAEVSERPEEQETVTDWCLREMPAFRLDLDRLEGQADSDQFDLAIQAADRLVTRMTDLPVSDRAALAELTDSLLADAATIRFEELTSLSVARRMLDDFADLVVAELITLGGDAVSCGR